MFVETASIIASLILIGLGVFQLLIATGQPYGHYAWGGQHKVLPISLRIGSVITVPIYVFIAAILLDRSEIVSLFESTVIHDYGIWVCASYFVIGIGMNLVSRSKHERMVMTPLVTILCVCSFVIAFGT